jgi:hypothetical protein
VNQGRALLDRRLDDLIENAIRESADEFKNFVDRNRAGKDAPPEIAGFPLAVKYVPTKRASDYFGSNDGLYIGADNFTWGKAVYVTGVDEPLSTAIYGRVGVVSWFDPTRLDEDGNRVPWRAFDARDPVNARLYLLWLQSQKNYKDAILTVHSNHWLHKLRNTFREQFRIDVVLCKPDETDSHRWYTKPTDIWLGVSDWLSPGVLAGGAKDTAKNYSQRFHDVRLTIVPEEEFTADDPALTRSPQFALSKAAPTTPSSIPQAYWTALDPVAYGPRTFVRVES